METWKNRTGHVETSYEAMQDNPACELKKIFEHLSVNSIDYAKLDECISKYSFESVTGRKHGEENAYCFVRKGIVGGLEEPLHAGCAGSIRSLCRAGIDRTGL